MIASPERHALLVITSAIAVCLFAAMPSFVHGATPQKQQPSLKIVDGLPEAETRYTAWLESAGLAQFLHVHVTQLVGELPRELPPPKKSSGGLGDLDYLLNPPAREYTLVVTPDIDRFAFDDLQSTFRSHNEVGLLEKMFFKFSAIVGAPTSKCMLTLNLDCAGANVWVGRGRLHSYGTECMSAGASTEFDTSRWPKLAGGAERDLPGQHRALGSAVERAVTNEISHSGRVVPAVKENSFWEFDVLSARGVLTAPANYWERLQIYLMFFEGKDTATIRCVVDGRYAAGSTEPSPQSYIDMEPAYSAQMYQLAQRLVLRVKTELEQQKGATK